MADGKGPALPRRSSTTSGGRCSGRSDPDTQSFLLASVVPPADDGGDGATSDRVRPGGRDPVRIVPEQLVHAGARARRSGVRVPLAVPGVPPVPRQSRASGGGDLGGCSGPRRSCWRRTGRRRTRRLSSGSAATGTGWPASFFPRPRPLSPREDSGLWRSGYAPSLKTHSTTFRGCGTGWASAACRSIRRKALPISRAPSTRSGNGRTRPECSSPGRASSIPSATGTATCRGWIRGSTSSTAW